jgi:23S rRNA (adenine2503-C2)-methyltransferase
MQVINQLKSSDGSIKRVHELDDGNFVESVIIPHKTKTNICVSTQVGCRMGCVFCATGKRFVRNLTNDEILTQIDVPVDSVVFMGTGEPLDNPDIVEAIERVKKEKNIPSRKIVVSTCGLCDRLDILLPTKVNIAISLNATDDNTRSRLMPINNKFNIELLRQKMFEIDGKLPSSRRLEIEYVVIKGVNDDLISAERFSQLVPKKSLINLIPFNATSRDRTGHVFQAPGKPAVDAFKQSLRKQGFVCYMREPRGKDVKAACGMLGGKQAEQ